MAPLKHLLAYLAYELRARPGRPAAVVDRHNDDPDDAAGYEHENADRPSYEEV